MSDFVHLHVHTQFSLLDGACRLRGLVSRVKELGQKAVAITDHGVMFGCVDFYNECISQGIKPIVGCEVYVAPLTRFNKTTREDLKPFHLVLLCKNNTGYKNLTKLVSLGYTEGFYGKPRCDKETLKKYSEGLVCLSGCLSGEIPRLLLDGKYPAALSAVNEYKSIFGDDFYIELQNHGIDEQKTILPYLMRLARDTKTKIVATNDAHYTAKEDSFVQKVLTCIATNTTLNDKNALHFPTDEFYIKSGDEMSLLFPAEAIEATVEIADKCSVDFEFGNTVLPYFKAPDNFDNDDYFDMLVQKGMHRRYGENPTKEITDRVAYETSVIRKMGYIDYFLIVADFISYAKSRGIAVGPGRGSGAGSVCAYCMGITDIDPIRFDLLFERFLNPERVSMPDFDIDFCYIRRQEVIDYVIGKYGRDHVAQIITFGTMAARGAIRDAGRAMGMPYAKVDSIAKLIPMSLHSTIDSALKTEKELIRLAASDNEISRLIETARKIEGMARNTSVHAAGIVITREPVTEYVPLYKSSDETVTQYTMGTLERLGLLKMDFLGLRYLTVIQDCCKLVQKSVPDFDIEKIPEDDEAAYEMMSGGGTAGIFQFESAGMTQLLSKLRPRSIEDLTAALSLYRPGPMDSIPKYISNRRHPEKIVYRHPLLKDILDVTYGCIVYQEQVMTICRVLGGYTYGRADIVRRAMAKKKQDVMMKEREIFIAGAVKNGVDENAASDIFDDMSSFAAYAFNKSHAAAYAVLAYRTAYLRRHYYKEYMVSLLTSVIGQSGKTAEYISDLNDNGITLLPPDINKSETGFSVQSDGIRFGLLAVKNLGSNVIEAIIEERKNGAFTGLYDFCSRMSRTRGLINKRAVESLIKCGAFDGLGNNRAQMMRSYEIIIDSFAGGHRNIEGQMDLFAFEEESPPSYVIPPADEFPKQQLLRMEKEIIGVYVSGHPLDSYKGFIRNAGCTHIGTVLSNKKDGERVKITAVTASKRNHITKQNKAMCFLVLEDVSGEMEAILFSSGYEQYAGMVNEGEILLFEGVISCEDSEQPKLLVNRISAPESSFTQKQAGKTVFIKVKNDRDRTIPVIQELLLRHYGTSPVRLCFEDTRTVNDFPDIKGVEISEEFVKNINLLCGTENIIIK